MKKFSKILDKLATDKHHFIVKRIMVRGKLDEAVELMLDIATQQESIMEIPADWFQHWKQRWLPRWLKRKYPVRMNWVYAITKFPELQVPQLGRSYLHLQVIDLDKLVKELEGD